MLTAHYTSAIWSRYVLGHNCSLYLGWKILFKDTISCLFFITK